jgi:hypothetical protein
MQTGGSERMRIDSSGNVGIGTSSPSRQLEIYDDGTNGQAVLALTAQNTENSRIMFADPDDNNIGILDYSHADDSMRFTVNNTERMRIDSSGNLLVGTTDTDPAASSTETGVALKGGGFVSISRNDSAASVNINKIGFDGSLVDFRKGGALVGSIGTRVGLIKIGSGDTGLAFNPTNDSIFPEDMGGTFRDAAIDLGVSAARFKDIYRSGSTYSTSDRNMKQDIRDLTDAERNVAVACKGLLKAFRFIDAVEKDGDDANIHFGVIAQELAEAFEAEGLDANDYQVYKSATTTDEDGNEQTRLNVCYENLLAFIIAAI